VKCIRFGLALLYISVRFALKLAVTVNVQVSLSVTINGPTRSDALDRTLTPSPARFNLKEEARRTLLYRYHDSKGSGYSSCVWNFLRDSGCSTPSPVSQHSQLLEGCVEYSAHNEYCSNGSEHFL
jgi:hypothetical protein